MKALFLILLLPLAMAQVQVQEEVIPGDDYEVFDMELEKLLNLGSSLLALGLAILTSIAYRRTRRKRLLFVGAAFTLFALKSCLVGSEVFWDEMPYVDQISSILDFAILACFFLGILKK